MRIGNDQIGRIGIDPHSVFGKEIESGDYLEMYFYLSNDLTKLTFPERLEKLKVSPNYHTHNFESRYDCTYYAADVVFNDGRSLIENEVDQFGIELDPDSQYNSKILFPEQWNYKIVSLEKFVGKKIVETSQTYAAYLDVRIVKRFAPQKTIDFVDTRRGTNNTFEYSRGNIFPQVAEPFGGIFGMPFTCSDKAPEEFPVSRPYTYSDENIFALGISHIPSPWISDWCPVMTFAKVPGELTNSASFNHTDEIAKPYLYSVDFDNGIKASLTVHGWTALIEYDFSGLSTDAAEIDINNVSEKSFLDIRFSAGEVLNVRKNKRSEISESLTYTVKLPAEKKITLYLTQSLISKEQAEANFEEINFSDAVEKLKSKLEKIFGKYEIEDENPEKLITFYSNLYRMHLYPNRTENGLSVNNGFWDTYRTIWPALFLLEPALSGELLNGFLQHFLDSDSEKGRGWIPRWSAPGPIDSMNGTHSDIVFANAISWDIDGFDWEKAFQASLKNANCESKNPAVGRKGIKDYLEKGYVPNSVPEGLSWTLENSYGDWAILQMAKKLGKSDLVKEFEKRSKNYESVFNKKCGFFIGKDDDGNWSETIENFDPRVWGGDYTETNAYGARFHPVYDQGGLLELYGGEKKLEKALDDFFFIQRETADKKFAGSYGFVIHEQSEAQDVRLGQAGISNQPAHHIPFVYSFCNSKSATRKMQMLVAQICDRLQVGSQIGQGYLGDEDNGEMSAWYFFSNIGLYPLNPVSGDFVIVAPRLKHIKIKLENGVLEIKAPNSSRKNCCVKRVVLNGKKYNGSTINYHDIKNGANIEFELEPFKGRVPK